MNPARQKYRDELSSVCNSLYDDITGGEIAMRDKAALTKSWHSMRVDLLALDEAVDPSQGLRVVSDGKFDAKAV